MDRTNKREAADRLNIAMDLFSAGCEMMERKLRREYPNASDETIERMLSNWLHDRPGAEFGDAVGTPGNRFKSFTCHE